MSIKKFFKQQFNLRKFLLQHDVSSDFYLASFQKKRSAIPLLIVRTVIFVGCLLIWIMSMVVISDFLPIKYWPNYLTHWGLVLNTIAAGFGLLVSVMASVKLPIDTNSGIPWYAKAYWAMFNIATPIAFFITVFYWALLFGLEQEFAVSLTLDIFIHAVNSILMFALLITSRQPSNILHFYFPIGLAIIYLIFSYVYFVSGGTDPQGNHTIYPMIDWERPGETVGIAALCTIGIATVHGVMVALTVGRDILSRLFRKNTTAYYMHET